MIVLCVDSVLFLHFSVSHSFLHHLLLCCLLNPDSVCGSTFQTQTQEMCVSLLAGSNSACLVSFREKAQVMKKSGMKRVLLLGSGYVSEPVVEYLSRDEKTQITVGESVFHVYSVITESCDHREAVKA